jgi:hypothetical protein
VSGIQGGARTTGKSNTSDLLVSPYSEAVQYFGGIVSKASNCRMTSAIDDLQPPAEFCDNWELGTCSAAPLSARSFSCSAVRRR